MVGGIQLKPLQISKRLKKTILGLETGQTLNNFTISYIGFVEYVWKYHWKYM